MNKAATLKSIQEHQWQWANSHGIAVAPNGRVKNLDENFFATLHPESRTEIMEGEGHELGTPEAVGKLYSLWSSTALACNVFDYWRGRPIEPLSEALQIAQPSHSIRFEQKFSTGVGAKAANLDVLLAHTEAAYLPVAIESKFSEPYQSGRKKPLKDSYFNKPTTWESLSCCRAVGKSLDANRFSYIDAGQLLKHIVALTRKFGTKGFVLINIWYDVEGSAAATGYRKEVAEFSRLIEDEVHFRVQTYQQLFSRLTPYVLETQYESYLISRYFEISS